MLNLVEKLDFLKAINEEIKQMINALHRINISQDDFKKSVKLVKIVGQEEDGILIFTWQLNLKSLGSTYIALYNHVTHKSRLIFTQEKEIEIVTASVNTTRSLVAFSIVEKKNISKSLLPGEIISDDVYKSYIAEIAPQNRVFYLNIEWRTFQKVKFICEKPGYGQHVSRMLFFHHKESIGLYHIPVVEKDNRFVMSMQPSTQQISDQFLWSQFDIKAQRLYIIKLIPLNDDRGYPQSTALLTIVEFRDDGEYDYVLKVPLPITLRANLMSEKPYYHNSYFSSIVSSKSFNMSVLTCKSGSFYLCYQHPATSPSPAGSTGPTPADTNDYEEEENNGKSDEKKSVSSVSSDSFIIEDNNTLSYTICCIHGGYKVQCSYSHSVANNTTISGNNWLLFTLFNDYVLVYLPNQFLHFLDISCEHEPVHNILINNNKSSLLPASQSPNGTSENILFSIIIESPADSAGHDFLLFERSTCKGFKFELSKEKMLEFYMSAKPPVRLAILHAAMNHLHENKVTQTILKEVCRDASRIEVPHILNEYLVLAAYIQMKRVVVSPLDLKIFPFTCQDVYRGQVERRGNGERMLYLQYKEFTYDTVLQFQRILKKRKGAFWSNLLLHLSYEVENRNKRFPLSQLRYAIVNSELKSNSKKLFLSQQQRRSVDLEKSLSAPSLRKLEISSRDTEDNDFRNDVCVDIIVSYVTRIFGRETRSKALNMCREYSTCRNKVITFLWKIVLKSLHLHKIMGDLMSVKLNEPITEADHKLFQLLEKIRDLTDQLCYPSIPNIKQLLCYYGFRCLSTYQFFQYVDACIIQIDEDFVRRVIDEIPTDNNDKENKLQFKMISYLSKEKAHVLLKEWNTEAGNIYLAKNILSHIPSDSVHYNTGFLDESEGCEDFIPLRTLLDSCKSLSKKSGFLRSSTNEMYKADILFVGKVALTNTNRLKS